MQVRFLLGPAGSGKTFRCLAEIRAELLRDPAGPPLLLLAPKQATFQLERQLLADGSLAGYTRLQILSFDRLARFVLEQLGPAQPKWLDDEGRVMVLRALLARHRHELKLFRSTARLPGFAARLSTLLREFQRHQFLPARLDTLAGRITSPSQLRDKLQDFSRLLRGYLEWLSAHGLQDADATLDAATMLLNAPSSFRLVDLWLDGFAEMTAQELDLLAAVVPLCEHATLAFCLNGEPREEPAWLSPWAVIGQTYLRCRERLRQIPGVKTAYEKLPQALQPTRFISNPTLAAVESRWSNPQSAAPSSILHSPTSLALFSCANPEAEAILAAREIRRFIRGGGRYRAATVIVRSLDSYADTLRRVFARYEIPCFIDRREPVTHHPLAELTRYALRLGAYGWRQPDWFGALKTGLAPVSEDEIDWLENLALEFGWTGDAWLQPLAVPERQSDSERAERLRQKLIPPFWALLEQVGAALSGKQLADALRAFWNALEVETTLERWNKIVAEDSALRAAHSAQHSTVLDQLHAWLENLERAFPDESLDVRDWLPILEAGLATLTVGVIPPALDQVSIGAIDRSRNPDLKFALVLGLNEGIFPAPPVEDPLLNELERDALVTHGAKLGPDRRHRIGHEWFYGYIACTRATERLVLTCAQFDSRGNPLNRSPFFDHLERFFPTLKPANWQAPTGFAGIEHVSEIIAPAIQLQTSVPDVLLQLPELSGVLAKARELAVANVNLMLPPALAEKLHGRELATSVSGLEDFAACPFKFFVSRSLRAEERKRFELDARERGSFQHDVLQTFHQELVADKLKWRDIPPESARERIGRIGNGLLAGYRNGLFAADETRRFAGEMLLGSLELFITVLVTWAKDYRFDPELVEAGFGLRESPWPAWRLDVGGGHALALRGRIDRVDVWRDEATGAALAVVMDYKSSSRKPDRLKLHHGLQLQLPAYLNVLAQVPEVRASLKASSIKPAGVFYVNLRGEFASTKSRAEAQTDPALTVREGFQHQGRFDDAFKNLLDPFNRGEQFKTGGRAHDRMGSSAFHELLGRAVENLRRFGGEIYSGKIGPEPFRKGSETACDFCDYASICRFDPWTQPFRVLKSPDQEGAG